MTQTYRMDLTRVRRQNEYPLGENFRGTSPDGRALGFTNRTMTLDGKPFFAVCGELHYSRVAPDQWDDSVLKLLAGGVNVLSTYVFWNVHEEREGVFRFDGQRDLRRFLAVCRRRGMLVILRIGPFGHGEMRNGGLPDWLYGKPFEVRGVDAGFLGCVRRLYGAIHAQADGMYFGQGGPIIGVQLDNEYMHSAAPWEATGATTAEWVHSGSDGEAYMRALREIALECGMRVPFFTATAWGGAIAPTDITLPLWGGYAYRPWIFYDRGGEHPATPEYVYRDNHNDSVPATYNFEPRYAPESMPFACCEMMGGMFCSYRYRFTLPMESVDAMANIKLGSGCAMLGYYMYRGGTTPLGECTPFLNEEQTPRRSYDFQAPVGEYGQLRPSWYRLRTLHALCESYAELLASAVTVLPDGGEIAPEDADTLRYCARVNGGGGFVFVNNFQDHAALRDRAGDVIELALPGETLRFGPFGLKAGENAVLPFNLRVGGALLKTATAQPITTLTVRGERCAFFFAPDGMRPVFAFDAASVRSVSGCETEALGGRLVCRPAVGSAFMLTTATDVTRVFVLSRADAMRFGGLRTADGDVAVLADAGVLQDGDRALVELSDAPIRVLTYPPRALRVIGEGVSVADASEGDFAGVTLSAKRSARTQLTAQRVSAERYTVDVPTALLQGHKTALLRVEYAGDVAQAFLGGEMIGDNFCNGNPWELRLDCYAERLAREPLTLHIVPVKENAKVNADTTMAARTQSVDGARARLGALTLVTIDEVALTVG